ncbi:MAG: HEAT repeat domain-containing protein, partial [Deltaproteobacteria bacterium]
DNRTVRNRTYNLLLRLKDITVPALRFKLQSLGDANVFPRNAEDGPLTDEAWYIMRNIIDLMAELDAFETLDTLEKIVADPDPRVRRECIAALAKHHNRHTHEIALRLIEDPNEEVREKAILALGSPHSREATPKLIDLFFAHPVHRQTILLSLSKIGGDEVRDFLVNAVRPQSAAMKRIFSGDIQIQAIKALGRIGDGDTEQKLRSFVRFHQNPFIRIYRLARRRHKRGRELLHAATQSLAQMEQRSRMNAAQSSEPPRVAAIR